MSMILKAYRFGDVKHTGQKRKVTGVDYIKGTLSAAVNWNANTAAAQGINGLTAGDFLYHADEGQNGAAQSAIFPTSSTAWAIIQGLQAWLPGTANISSTDSFGGVNRSVSSRLAGLNFSFTGVPLDEALNRVVAGVYANGGKPSHVFMNPATWAVLMNLLQSKVTYFRPAPKEEGHADIGFESVRVFSPGGQTIDIVADPFCPSSKMFVLQMNTWCLRSTNSVPYIQDIGGQPGSEILLRINTGDQVELRIAAYAQLVCRAPGWNALCTIDAITSY